jgi:hypothetical protein
MDELLDGRKDRQIKGLIEILRRQQALQMDIGILFRDVKFRV